MENADLINNKTNRLGISSIFGRYVWFYMLFPVLAVGFYLRIKDIGSLGVVASEMVNVQRVFDQNSFQNLLGKNISTNLYYAIQFVFGNIFGFSAQNMRILTVFLSLLGIVLFYLFVKEWFNKRMAQVATFLLSISSFHILLSRSISHEILFFDLSLAIFYFLTMAFRQKKQKFFLISGVLIGLSFYASELTFSLVLLFLLSGIYFYKRNRKFVTAYTHEITVSALTAFLVALPFFVAFVRNPRIDMFTLNIGLIEQNIYSLFAFFWGGQVSGYMYNIGSTSLFDPLVLATFVVGIMFCILKVKRRKYYFLLGWLSIGMVVLALKTHLTAGDLAYILPVVFIASAIMIDFLLSRWLKTFPFNRAARASLIVGIGFFLGISFSYNFAKIFYAWSKYPYRRYEYNVDVLEKIQKQKGTLYVYKPFADKKVMAVILGKAEKELFVVTPEKLNEASTSTTMVSFSSSSGEIKEKYSLKYSQISLNQNLALFKGKENVK